MAAGVRYSEIGDHFALTNNGRYAFHAVFAQGTGSVTAANDTGLLSGTLSSPNLQLVAREGSAAPGTTGVFTSLDGVLLHEDGNVAFRASLLSGTGGVTVNDDSGLWTGLSSSPTLLAREGSQAGGLAAGVNYAGFNFTDPASFTL